MPFPASALIARYDIHVHHHASNHLCDGVILFCSCAKFNGGDSPIIFCISLKISEALFSRPWPRSTILVVLPCFRPYDMRKANGGD